MTRGENVEELSRALADELSEFDNVGKPPDKIDINVYIERYATARSAREEVSDAEKRLREVEAAAEADLFKALERLSLRQARHKTLGLFSMNDLAQPVITDEAELRAWAQMEAPELLLPNRQRLGKMLRDRLKEGDPLVPGTDVTFWQKITWRKG